MGDGFWYISRIVTFVFLVFLNDKLTSTAFEQPLSSAHSGAANSAAHPLLVLSTSFVCSWKTHYTLGYSVGTLQTDTATSTVLCETCSQCGVDDNTNFLGWQRVYWHLPTFHGTPLPPRLVSEKAEKVGKPIPMYTLPYPRSFKTSSTVFKLLLKTKHRR